MTGALRHRPEIDGLRALAVILVVLFHAGFDGFRGGYIGVDVFFVISGYLITRIIFAEIETGEFSLSNFYERRARRILPALFFAAFTSVPFAWIILTPSEMKDFAQSLAAVAVFSSNMLFYSESGYFDAASELKPLLHTWSLAVEEQYYILFPVFLLAAARLRKSTFVQTAAAVFIVIFVVSFIAAHAGAQKYPEAVFYMLPTRIWEILTGSLCALCMKRKNFADFRLSGILSVSGFALILYAVFFLFNSDSPVPGFYMTAPAAGTALIILFTADSSLTARLAGGKFPVTVGLLSYSIYLWHWIVLCFARHMFPDGLSAAHLCAVFALTAGLSWFSWCYVERPFRRRGGAHSAADRYFSAAHPPPQGFFCSALRGILLTDLKNL